MHDKSDDRKKDLKQQLEELVYQRDRAGKRKLTGPQRIKLLNQIYDGTLFWLQACVIAGKASGSGAAMAILERARNEIVAWEHSGITQTGFNITFDLPLVEDPEKSE